MGVEPLGVIVEHEDDLVLDVYLREPFRELHQVARAREWMALAHVNEAEEVRDPWPQQRERMLQDMDVRAAALSRQIGIGGFRRRIRPSAAVIREQKQWSSSLPW